MCSLNTVAQAVPSIEPAPRTPSTVIGMSISFGRSTGVELPPGITPLMAPPAGPPAYSWMRVDSFVPTGSSHRPGRFTCPDTPYIRRPPSPGTPSDRNAWPPFSTIHGTVMMVSTLFTMVGHPKAPTTAGNGGLRRGSPRLPSREFRSAVSSPQMYAPPPRCV